MDSDPSRLRGGWTRVARQGGVILRGKRAPTSLRRRYAPLHPPPRRGSMHKKGRRPQRRPSSLQACGWLSVAAGGALSHNGGRGKGMPRKVAETVEQGTITP